MPITRQEAESLTTEFCKTYPVALQLAYRFGETTAELYGSGQCAYPNRLDFGDR